MVDCIFCKIIAGELPSTKIYEDDNVLAFLDISPINPGHTLVVPKEHSQDLASMSEEALQKVTPVVKKVGQAILDGLGADGFNIGLNNGRIAGQEVDHVHFHVIPRHKGDGLKHWSDKEYKEGEMERVAKSIKEGMAK